MATRYNHKDILGLGNTDKFMCTFIWLFPKSITSLLITVRFVSIKFKTPAVNLKYLKDFKTSLLFA